MTTRRGFLTGLMATGLLPVPSWAEAGNPAFLNAARLPNGQYVLLGLDPVGGELFRLPLPDRGHATTAHPTRPEAVAFARRPGTYAFVIDCTNGKTLHQITAPSGRHFYGHGTFSMDGKTLFTTENNYEAGEGRIGVWDAANGYVRKTEFSSGGIGPHDLKRLPGKDVLIVANGGIDTHPDSGRTKLNIPTMQPNLSYVATNGQLLDTVTLPADMHKSSIRHLAVANDGTVAFGMQWQGDAATLPLLGLHRRGTPVRLLAAPKTDHRALNGYVGSVAMNRTGTVVAISSPRGNVVQLFDTITGAFVAAHEEADVCGVGTMGDGFVISTGTGHFGALKNGKITRIAQHNLQFDNHLVPVQA